MTARVDDDDDFTLIADSRPSVRGRRGPSGRRSGERRRWAWLAFLTRRPARTIVGAAVSALLTGIVVNALVMQKEKHPAPLFVPAEATSPSLPPQAHPAPIMPAHAADSAPVDFKKDAIGALLAPSTNVKPVATIAPQAAPVSRPKDSIAALIKGGAADKPRTDNGRADSKPGDSIAALIKSNTAAEGEDKPSETIAAAQRALVRLGFVLRADGVLGAASKQAVELFERDHGLPVDGELSPRVMKQLSELSGIAIR